ncbi:MAG: alpha/beta hydrolase, partial [Muribaculaceae bacterium]
MMSLMCGTSATVADLYGTIANVSYIEGNEADAYRVERCKLDLYVPEGKTGFPTVVFFHGGGLEGGEKFVPELLKEQGFAVVAPNYRLSPRAQHPAYIEDAAAAVAWTMRHIAEYGGTSSKVWVCGHSAGGYLTLMLALDKSYLGAHGVDA